MDAAGLPELGLGTIRLCWLFGRAFRLDGAAVFGQAMHAPSTRGG